MIEWACRWSGFAIAALWLATMPASAGDLSTKATEAETALSAGRTSDAIIAFDAAVDAFWKAAPLTFRKAIFVDSARGYGDYVVHEGSSFAPASTLTVYAEPIGYGFAEAAGGYKIGFSTEVEIRGRKDLVLSKSAAPVSLEQTLKAKSHEFQITIAFALPAMKAGDYTLVLKVTDAATAKTATIELPFTVTG